MRNFEFEIWKSLKFEVQQDGFTAPNMGSRNPPWRSWRLGVSSFFGTPSRHPPAADAKIAQPDGSNKQIENTDDTDDHRYPRMP
jgi:hypothetical protein